MYFVPFKTDQGLLSILKNQVTKINTTYGIQVTRIALGSLHTQSNPTYLLILSAHSILLWLLSQCHY